MPAKIAPGEEPKLIAVIGNDCKAASKLPEDLVTYGNVISRCSVIIKEEGFVVERIYLQWAMWAMLMTGQVRTSIIITPGIFGELTHQRLLKDYRMSRCWEELEKLAEKIMDSIPISRTGKPGMAPCYKCETIEDMPPKFMDAIKLVRGLKTLDCRRLIGNSLKLEAGRNEKTVCINTIREYNDLMEDAILGK